MNYNDPELEQALCDIANKKGNWQTRAPNVCARAMHRMTELENIWDTIREKAKEMHEVAHNPNATVRGR